MGARRLRSGRAAAAWSAPCVLPQLLYVLAIYGLYRICTSALSPTTKR